MFNFNTKRRNGKTTTIPEFCKIKIKQKFGEELDTPMTSTHAVAAIV